MCVFTMPASPVSFVGTSIAPNAVNYAATTPSAILNTCGSIDISGISGTNSAGITGSQTTNCPNN